jgi:alpha-L-arabinofuranosidase
MRRSVSLVLLLAATVAAGSSAARAEAPSTKTGQARLIVHADRSGPKISPMLYGIFFEEINLAGDGGLYAELIRNRSFEDANEPEHWRLANANSAKNDMAIDTERPLSQNNRRSLRLKIRPPEFGVSGVANGGYYGIPLDKDAEYDLSLYARCGDGFTGPLTVTLSSLDGNVYAEAKIDGLADDWRRFTTVLKSNSTVRAARLVLSARQPGTIWIDVVSLFPRKTWKDRPNGLRPDLAQMLADLKPSFVRFPGGCWVEGDTLDLAMRWKKTIGDIAERRTQYNIWQYYSTNGLGFHEYLQMCEDLGAEPLFVINCGMSHRQNVPMDKVSEWVQDALDAIEYCNGPTDSTWGSLRAKAGHPAPFNLEYMEIGNENGGPAYQERYALFYDAIKAKYPQMKLIADVPTEKRPADIVDEHYYSSPDFFIANAGKYDTYDRKGPRIYVGEYAVTQNCGTGNLRGALGEAAFMTGMERNSDVVVMASYAPLFANVNYKKWNPDLINFDGTRVYGTPSYYVQKMFSQNRADVVLPLTLEMAEPLPEVKPGAIGLSTWATQAEFKDIKVTQGDKALFQSDFSRGLEGWRAFRGDWKIQAGALRQMGGGDDERAVAGDPTWGNYTYSLKARKLGGAEGFLILFQVRDNDNWLWWNLGGWGNVRHGIERCVAGGKSILGSEVPGRIETGRWYDIRIELKGLNIKCYLDGKLIHDVTHQPIRPIHAVGGRVDATGEIILKVVNVTDSPQETQIDLRGVGEVQPKGTATVLTSTDPNDENSLRSPTKDPHSLKQLTKVAPVTRAIDNAGPSFRHVFPAYSLTVLRLKGK